MPKGGCIETLEWVSGQVSDRCPVMYVDDQAIAFQSYLWAKRGFLPSQWLNEPTGLMRSIDIIWDAVDAEELRQAKARAG